MINSTVTALNVAPGGSLQSIILQAYPQKNVLDATVTAMINHA